MNRWKATLPYEWSGAWEGRLQITYDYDTKTDVCGHLHGTSADAGRCAQELAERLNFMLRQFDPRIPEDKPADYYLG